jgi:ABC-2 type transport system permease protein
MNAPVATYHGGQFRALFRRELRSLFLSPISYLVWVTFLIVTGWIFVVTLKNGGAASLDGQFRYTAFLLVFVTPLLTMRLLADEHRLGTLESLLTDPIRERTIVLAKYAAVLIFFTLLLTPTLAYPVILHSLGEPDLGPIAGGFLGIFLLGALFLAIGLFCSAVTMNTIGAAALGFTILLLLWLLSLAADGMAPSFLRDLLEYLSAFTRFEPLRRGVVDSRSLIWAFTLITWMLTISTFALALRRRR